MKVSELTGSELDYWTAKAQGLGEYKNWEDGDYDGEYPCFLIDLDGYCWWYENEDGYDPYRPSTDWQQAGELIEKFKVKVWYSSGKWVAETYKRNRVDITVWGVSSTPQEAICRAVVASVYGEEVEDE